MKHLVLLILLLFLLAGCAGTSTFTSYPSKINPYIHKLQTGRPISFNECLVTECSSADLILYTMERGRMAQIVDSLDVSMNNYLAAIGRIKELDDKAVISASNIGAQVAAVAINDNAIPYEGEGYERISLYHYQALNYLKKNDLDGAAVEVRRANREQEDALKKFEKEVLAAQSKAHERRVQKNQLAAVYQSYAQLDEIAGRVKNSFQNAYTFYLSGVVYELLGEPNDAYIDYKRALEIFPNNTYLQQDVLRLAATLKMDDDLAELKEQFPFELRQVSPDDGDLLILFEDGFVPQKREFKVSIPLYGSGIISVAFPLYTADRSQSPPLSLSVDGQGVGTSELICDFRTLAVKALREKVPLMATRQILRAFAKGTSAHKAKKEGGAAGELLVSIWNIISENADLRSWLTLPATAQILRTPLASGRHSLSLTTGRDNAPETIDVTIEAGTTTLIHLVRAGSRYYPTVTRLTPRNSQRSML